MRRSHALLVVVLLAGCTVEAPPAGTANATLGAGAPTAPAASASATTTVPDWTTTERLDGLVTATLPFPADWPRLSLATATGTELWWPNGNEGAPPAVARIDPATMEIDAVVRLGGTTEVFPPDAWGSARSRHGIWVPLAYQRAIALIDPETNKVSRRIEVDATPYAIVEVDDELWIADWENSAVVAIDVEEGTERVRVDGIREPTEIAFGPEGLWVNEHAGTHVVRLDPETGDELARIDIGGRPGLLLGLGSVWARSDDEKSVMRIDPATNTVVATISLPGNPTGGVVAAGSVWVAGGPQRGSCVRTSFLARIDPVTNAVDGLLTKSCTFGLLSDGTRIWIGSAEEELAEIHRLEPADRS